MSSMDGKHGFDSPNASNASPQSLKDVELDDKEQIDNDHHRAGSESTGETVREDYLDKIAEEQVTNLARQITRQRTRQSVADGDSLGRIGTRYSLAENAVNPFTELKEGSSIDPDSPNFNARAWIKNLLSIQSRDPDRYPRRTAGFSFKNLSVHGFGTPTDYQKDVFNVTLEVGSIARTIFGGGKNKIQILRNFDGLVKSGEMLVVLGRPGSGCSTFLKSISGEMNGIYLDENSYLNYQGVPAKDMHTYFRGEAIYNAETDVHFPQLSVGDTLDFAARARAPSNRIPGVTRAQHARRLRDVAMAVFGLSHTVDTRVGNDYIRGVSGGERKRVSIAEAILSNAPLQCWDNSTRGLDSANALEFCKNLRLGADYMGATMCVAIYQASQSAYDIFDKVIVLYEGRQIYFGRTDEARQFFVDMGFECPERQTTADFLTSLTSPVERIVRPGFEGKTPNTPDEFAAAWKNSAAYQKLMKEIEENEQKYPPGGHSMQAFIESRKASQSPSQRIKSPYTLSVIEQVRLCMRRGFQRLRGDYSLTISALIGNFVIAVIVGSAFYNQAEITTTFYSRGALLFYAILLAAFSSALEILTLYAQRPIVEKHNRYAFYHPFAEALASMVCDLPYKFINSFTFNIPLYFMTNLRRTGKAFWTYWLISITTTLSMSMLFRSIASSSRSLAQAMPPAALLMLALVIFTGFALPVRSMLGWSRWINWLDPVAYGFEAVMANEFHDRYFSCGQFVPAGPGYDEMSIGNKVCATNGAKPGENMISGDVYLYTSYEYEYSHLWRNFGIIIAFGVFFCCIHLLTTEYISEQKSKGEVLLFRRGHQPPPQKHDEEAGVAEKSTTNTKPPDAVGIQRQTAIFQWQDVCYDVKIKGNDRRILDHVDGWVKPGTCTALMGVSGAGKTTLLDVLATRVTMGVVSGEMLVNGQPRDGSFQRKTGYVQQQDVHLWTTTVREALEFSALLRQPISTPRAEKIAYVSEIIKLLEMESYADAVVGVPGEGLNVEQRKRLTIGVELAAKPQLLLFLDEPTSGLDSQTSWSILNLLDTLTAHGQAILCTIHQPSAMLFQRFDRLLFLAEGGRTVYFGEIGEHSKTLSGYFEKNGASPCPPDANPAEWMLEVIGAAPGSHSDIDWPEVWNNSPEKRAVREHLAELKSTLPTIAQAPGADNEENYRDFAAPFKEQLYQCLKRVFAQYWRTPTYIYAKFSLCTFTALFVGFVFFKAHRSLQGMQNQMFSIFMLLTVFNNLCQQSMPSFTTQRALYEVRERPAKTYSWKAFMLANIIVELPWSTLMAVFMFFCWYYPIGLYENAVPNDQVHERGALMFLYILVFFLFASTFSHMIIAGIEVAETGGNIATLLFSLCLIFCGVLVTKDQLPGFWIFMYRVSPFTYIVAGMLSTGLSGAEVQCEDYEYVQINPPPGRTCWEYMGKYIEVAGGYFKNANATGSCDFCTMSSTDTFLASVGSYYSDAWRNFGLIWAYIFFNVAAALFIYWLVRVPKGSRSK
ncbi:hypothetical protein KEM54_005599 [Ascosphaera aggregata]|nr:hypothetical protein KEM54_005599 [Ascosphaera aggregata]